MKSRKPAPHPHWRELCAELGPEDGLDPKEILKSGKQRRRDRKTLQMCAAVRRLVEGFLPDQLAGLGVDFYIDSVSPDPDEARLLVSLRLLSLPEDFDPLAFLKVATQSIPSLRAEIARSINRKQTPQLSLTLLFPDLQEERT